MLNKISANELLNKLIFNLTYERDGKRCLAFVSEENKSHDKYIPLEFQFFKNNTHTDKKFREFQSLWFHRLVDKEFMMQKSGVLFEDYDIIQKRILKNQFEIIKTLDSMNKITKRIQGHLLKNE